MTAKNDVTGDSIKSKVNSEEYRNNWEAIFKKKKEETESPKEEKNDDSE